MKPFFLTVAAALWLVSSLPACAQTADLERTIRQKDSLFWVAYNKCDYEGMHEFIAGDVEFYHDKGGVQKGWDVFLQTTRKNLCERHGWRLRREAVAESYAVFPMEDNGKPYGAILSGEHQFYVTQNGQPEFVSGSAKFTHLWLLNDGKWKMSRILSYDHGAPKPGTDNYENKRKAIALPEKAIAQFAGTYKSKQGDLRFENTNKGLVLFIRDNTYRLFPESENSFFYKERDLTFEFVKSEGKVVKVVVRENGAVVEQSPIIK